MPCIRPCFSKVRSGSLKCRKNTLSKSSDGHPWISLRDRVPVKKSRQRELLSTFMPTVMNWRSSYRFLTPIITIWTNSSTDWLTASLVKMLEFIYKQTTKRLGPGKGKNVERSGERFRVNEKSQVWSEIAFAFPPLIDATHEMEPLFTLAREFSDWKKKDKWLWKCHLRWKRDMTDYMKCLHPFLTGLLLPGCVMWGVIGEGRREIARAII